MSLFVISSVQILASSFADWVVSSFPSKPSEDVASPLTASESVRESVGDEEPISGVVAQSAIQLADVNEDPFSQSMPVPKLDDGERALRVDVSECIEKETVREDLQSTSSVNVDVDLGLSDTSRSRATEDEAIPGVTSAPSAAHLAEPSATSSTSTEAATVSSIGDGSVQENDLSAGSTTETSREATLSPTTGQLQVERATNVIYGCVNEGIVEHNELLAEAPKSGADEVEKQQAELILTLREEVSQLNRKVRSLEYDIHYYECLDKTATFKEAKSKQTITAMEGEIQVLRSLVNELSSKASIQSTSERAIGLKDSRGQLDQATERQMPKRLFSSTSSYDPDSISFSESLSCDSHSELSMVDIEGNHIAESAESAAESAECASSSDATKEDSKAAEVLTQSSVAVEIVKVHKKRCCLM